MEIIDLSHPLNSDMPVYPGTDKPQFIDACTIEKDGFNEKLIHMHSHTGTHVDAPAHLIAGAKTLDKFEVSFFMGSGVVVDVSGTGRDIIDLDDLLKHEKSIAGKEYVLFYSGWCKLWGKEEYYHNFPVLSDAAASWLLENDKLKGIGLDMISIDKVGATVFSNHMQVLGREKIIIENLNNTDLLLNRDFIFSCLPLRIENCDGISVRAVGII